MFLKSSIDRTKMRRTTGIIPRSSPDAFVLLFHYYFFCPPPPLVPIPMAVLKDCKRTAEV